MVTQKDLAARLGISYSTVSLALAGSPKINTETSRLVREAAEKLGYRPNLNARALQSRCSRLIGVIFPEFSHAYYNELARNIHPLLKEAGYTGMFFTCEGQSDFRDVINELSGRGVDGIISGLNDPESLLPLCRSGVGIVVYRQPGPLPCSSVDVDREHGGYLAGRHLIDLGYRRLGYLGGAPGDGEGRLQGFMSAVAEAGLELPLEMISNCGSGLENGYNGMMQLLSRSKPPQAVFAFNDATAIGGMRAVHDSGLRVPDQVAMVGFDDIRECRFVVPALTTIAQPREETARQLVTLMLDRLASAQPEIRRVLLKPQLVIRESCGTKLSAPASI